MRKRAAREAQARMVAAYATQRLDLEADEEKSRLITETQAYSNGNELAFHFYHVLVMPKSRMMIPRPLFDELKINSQIASQQSSEIRISLQKERRSLEQQNLNLQEELRSLRRDFRTLAQAVDLHCRKEQSAVLSALQEVIRTIDDSITQHRSDCVESPQLLNKALEESRLAHREYAQKALDAAAQITTATYGKATFAHTRIPLRIRNKLRNSSVEDLMLLFDTVSFEDGALQFLLHKFPPDVDCPAPELEEDNPFK